MKGSPPSVQYNNTIIIQNTRTPKPTFFVPRHFANSPSSSKSLMCMQGDNWELSRSLLEGSRGLAWGSSASGERLLALELLTISAGPLLLVLPWTLSLVPACYQLLTSTTPASETSSAFYVERVISVSELFLFRPALDFCDPKGIVCIVFLSGTWATCAL